MIAKRITKSKDGSGFGALVSYISNSEKAEVVFSNNIAVLGNAASEMNAIANMNKGNCETVSHIVLSWNKHERPTDEQMQECVRAQMKALGYEHHQYVGAIHRDRDHHHVHIAVNKVNPFTFKVHNPHLDFFVMDKACRESEIENGWSHDNNIYSVEYINGEPIVIHNKDRQYLKEISDKSVKMEFYRGVQSFESYIKENKDVANIVSKAKSWQEVHDKLRVFGLHLHESNDKNGLVISHPETDRHSKASLIAGYDAKEISNRLNSFRSDARKTDYEIETTLNDLTKTRAWFSEKDLDAYLICFIDEDRRDALKQSIINSEFCIHLNSDIKTTFKGEIHTARFTTSSVLAEERDCLQTANQLGSRPGPTVTAWSKQAATNERTMRPDQLAVYDNCLMDGGLKVVRGRAGTGKSYMMAALKDAYQGSGCTVIGLAPTNEVCAAMAKDGFETTQTVDAAICAFEAGKLKWDRNTVLIVDEAGMISNDRMRNFLKAAEAAGAKTILIGDDRQLPAVERGGMFAELAARFDGGEISVITRQKEAKQLEAAQLLSELKFEEAMAIYHNENRIKWSKTDDNSRDQLLEKYAKDFLNDNKPSSFVISYKNEDVDFFNRQIHNLKMNNPKLSGFKEPKTIKTTYGNFEFAIGEEIRFGENAKKNGITNGLRGTITSWTKNGMVVKAANGKDIEVDFSTYSKFRHGHAGTTYASQGKSIENVYVHWSKQAKDAASYVNLTRQTKECFLFASKESATDWRNIAKQMGSTMLKTTASSIGIGQTVHFPNPIQDNITKEAAATINKIKEANGNMAATAATLPMDDNSKDAAAAEVDLKEIKPRYTSLLRAEYNDDVHTREAEWLSKIKDLKKTRDCEVQLIRDQREYERKNAIGNLKQFDKETADLIKDKKECHGRNISIALSERPPTPEFKEWLSKQNTIEAINELGRLNEIENKRPATKADMIDLNKIFELNEGWKRDQKTPELAAYTNQNGQKIVIRNDQNGSGISWFDPIKKVGGNFHSLMKELGCNHLKDELLKAAIDPMKDNETKKLYEHRTLSMTAARHLWESGKPVYPNDSKELAKLLGDRIKDARYVDRPHGRTVYLANRLDGNIVGVEALDEKYQSITRGSNFRAATAVPTLRQNEKRARQAEQTPEISQGLAVMKRIVVNTKLDDLTSADLTLATQAAKHLQAHPRTLTIDERKALTTFEPIKHAGNERSAEQERQEAKEAQRQEAIERREQELERQRQRRPEPEQEYQGLTM